MLDAYKIYTIALLAGGVFFLLLAVWAARMTSLRLPKWESLPRNRNVGLILAFLCLLWCVPHAKPIVWEWMLPWLFPLTIIFSILSYFFLDYLFSRATGGFFILLTYYFIHGAFTFQIPVMALFAICCWVLGITGLFFSGKPHLMRDFIRKLAKSPRTRYLVCNYFSIFAVFCIVLGIILTVRG